MHTALCLLRNLSRKEYPGLLILALSLSRSSWQLFFIHRFPFPTYSLHPKRKAWDHLDGTAEVWIWWRSWAASGLPVSPVRTTTSHQSLFQQVTFSFMGGSSSILFGLISDFYSFGLSEETLVNFLLVKTYCRFILPRFVVFTGSFWKTDLGSLLGLRCYVGCML